MANIIGIENMSEDELRREIENGGRFVQYIWCISLLLFTFKQPTDIYFIRAGESAAKKGLYFTFLTLFLGWWGIPWGPIYTLQCLGQNLSGGYDLTSNFLANLASEPEQDDVSLQNDMAHIETNASIYIDDKTQQTTNISSMNNPNGPVIQRRR